MSVAGNVTITTAAVFIPEVWAEPIDNFHKAAKRLTMRVRDVSELMPAGAVQGDTIHVPRVSAETVQTVTPNTSLTFKTNTDPETTLNIDQHKAVAKRIEDMATIQAHTSLLIPYVQSMVYGWHKNTEAFVAAILQTATAHDVSLTTDNQLTAAEFRNGEQNLMDQEYDIDLARAMGQLSFYSSAAIKQYLKGLGVFVETDKTGVAPGAGITGEIAKAYGTPLTNSTDWGSAGTTGEEGATLFDRTAVLFAMQQNLTLEHSRAHAAGVLGDNVTVSGIFGGTLTFPAANANGLIVNFNNP